MYFQDEKAVLSAILPGVRKRSLTHTRTHRGKVGQQQGTNASQRCASADTSAGGTVLSDKKQAAVRIFLSLSREILKRITF